MIDTTRTMANLMQKRSFGVFIAAIVLLVSWHGFDAARAQSSGGAFAITRSTVVPAATLGSSAFQLRSTVGQTLAGAVSGSGYVLNAGFEISGDEIFQNGFEN